MSLRALTHSSVFSLHFLVWNSYYRTVGDIISGYDKQYMLTCLLYTWNVRHHIKWRWHGKKECTVSVSELGFFRIYFRYWSKDKQNILTIMRLKKQVLDITLLFIKLLYKSNLSLKIMWLYRIAAHWEQLQSVSRIQ